jgi:diphosphomevalonate decarboxylase
MKTSAPSNIALIKYMGKIEGAGNKPTNASLSWTMENLRTEVDLQVVNGPDQWEPLGEMKLKPAGIEKFLAHLRFLKSQWKIDENFQVKSGNNFPSDCGLASSASSFAALTLTAAQTFQKTNPQSWGEDLQTLSRLSRQGSGSSCRSFFSPWALWKEEGAEAIDLSLKLLHAVIILESEPKKVSSSEAHKRVLTSPRFEGRIKRASQKLEELISLIRQENWKIAREIVWDEFEDMHELFHTSQQPFRYITPKAREILDWSKNSWKKEGHGPWVTLDAGPNIHFLFEKSDLKFADRYMKNFAKENFIQSWKKN